MKIRLAMLGCVAVLCGSCADSVQPGPPIAPIAGGSSNLYFDAGVDGPTLIGKNQTRTWTVTNMPPVACAIRWRVGSTTIGYGASINYSAGTNFTLNVEGAPWGCEGIGNSYGGGMNVTVWQGCDPNITDHSTGYCDATISTNPNGAQQYQSCYWFLNSNMPLDNAQIDWYVNDQYVSSGVDFSYAHDLDESFTIHVVIDNPFFAGREHSKNIAVSGSTYNCNE